jgi:hypothetical protein
MDGKLFTKTRGMTHLVSSFSSLLDLEQIDVEILLLYQISSVLPKYSAKSRTYAKTNIFAKKSVISFFFFAFRENIINQT